MPETMCNFSRHPQALCLVIKMLARKLVIMTANGGLQLLSYLIGRNLSILIQIVHNQLVLCVQYTVRARVMGVRRAWRWHTCTSVSLNVRR